MSQFPVVPGDEPPRRMSQQEAALRLAELFLSNATTGRDGDNSEMVAEMCQRIREQQHPDPQ